MGPRPPVQRWFTGLLALGLALPLPAYALRTQTDRVGLEEALGRSPTARPEPSRKTGLEEDALFAGTLDDRPDLQEVLPGEFTMIPHGQVKTGGAVTCMTCAIYIPGRAGPALLAHFDPDSMRYPTSYKRVAGKIREVGLDLSSVRVVLLIAAPGTTEAIYSEVAKYRRVRRGLQRALQRLGMTLADSRVVETQDRSGVALDADTGQLFRLDQDHILTESPARLAADVRFAAYEARLAAGVRPVLTYVEFPPATAGLEEDDDFIFELARSRTPLTAEDVYRVKAWVLQQDAGQWLAQYQLPLYRKPMERLVEWVNATHGDRANPDRYPGLAPLLRRVNAGQANPNEDPLVLAVLTHWLFWSAGTGEATHRIGWLVMNILLARAGLPMIAYQPQEFEDGEPHYYELYADSHDPHPFINWIRQEVERVQTAPVELTAAQVTDLLDSPEPYRMLVEKPEGVKTPCELFITHAPLRIVYQGETAGREIQRIVDDALAHRTITADMATVEKFRPGMNLANEAFHTILVRTSGDAAIADSTPSLLHRPAMITLAAGMGFEDVLRQALAQWANRPIESIRPFQRIILRGKRLDFYA